jgi:hypothetical protein
MPNKLPVTFSASPLVPGKAYTPQQLLDAIVARLAIDSQTELTFFVSGTTEPTSNVGPWLKNGTTWYVWSDTIGAYMPQEIAYQSLRYIASETAPDQYIYTLWIRLDSSGKAQEIRYYSGGAWKSVYDDSFLAVLAQIEEAKQQYPFRGDSPADQQIASPGASVDIDFSETFDPANVFASSQFTAPTAGYYQINLKVAMESFSGPPTNSTIIVWLLKNGNKIATEFSTVPIVNGVTGLRTYTISTILQLVGGDVISAYVEDSHTSGFWLIKKEGTCFSGHRVLTP